MSVNSAVLAPGISQDGSPLPTYWEVGERGRGGGGTLKALHVKPCPQPMHGLIGKRLNIMNELHVVCFKLLFFILNRSEPVMHRVLQHLAKPL